MMHKHGLEALNRSLQDIRDNDDIMGGLIVILAGDFRQTLPVIPRGTMIDEIKACIKSSQLWRYAKTMKLQTNMRVQRSNGFDAQTFSDYLLSIGNGQEKSDAETGKITLCKDFCMLCPNLNSLINHVYPNINQHISDHEWLQKRAILAPINVKVDEINSSIQEMMPVAARSFYSIDKIMDEEEATSYPVEFLNSLNTSGLPQHKLTLKVGSPIMLLRNLDPPKLCNGTRLVVKTLNTYVIEATILTGAFKGENVFLPRIPLIPSDLPFRFKRLQFPIRLAFAMTINKSQGQSLNVTGIDLRDECFSHGQFYVAMSRAENPKNLYVLAENNSTKNIVYAQVLKD
jgi:ATP-dependent DNA helicase PIF1